MFCHFKNGTKSIFASEKSLKLPKKQLFCLKKQDFLTGNYTLFHISAQWAMYEEITNDEPLIEMVRGGGTGLF